MDCPSCGTITEEGYFSISGRILGAGWSAKKTFWGIGTIEVDLGHMSPANRCPSCGTLVFPHAGGSRANEGKGV